MPAVHLLVAVCFLLLLVQVLGAVHLPQCALTIQYFVVWYPLACVQGGQGGLVTAVAVALVVDHRYKALLLVVRVALLSFHAF